VGLDRVLFCAYNADIFGKTTRYAENIEEAKLVARQEDSLEVKEQEYNYVWSRIPIIANKFR